MIPHDTPSILEAAKSCMQRYQSVGLASHDWCQKQQRVVFTIVGVEQVHLCTQKRKFTKNEFLSYHQLYPMFAAMTVTGYVADSSKHGDNDFHQKSLHPR